MRYENPELRQLLAAEYVLGTLRGRARQRFEGLMHASPDLRREVGAWEERLNPLSESAPAVTPPEGNWKALQKRLFAQPSPSSWLEHLGLWRSLTIGSSLLAGVLAFFMIVEMPQDMPGYVVMINDAAERPVWMVSTPRNMDKLYVRNLKAMDMPRDVQCLLWVRPEGSEKLYVLGKLPDQGDDAVLIVDENMRSLLPGELLVSVEHSSSPVPDSPESPLVYEGKWMPLTKI